MPLVTAADASAAVRYRVTRTIPAGNGPHAVAVDRSARTVYVANADDDTVSVINAATGTVTRTIPVGPVSSAAQQQMTCCPSAGILHHG